MHQPKGIIKGQVQIHSQKTPIQHPNNHLPLLFLPDILLDSQPDLLQSSANPIQNSCQAQCPRIPSENKLMATILQAMKLWPPLPPGIPYPKTARRTGRKEHKLPTRKRRIKIQQSKGQPIQSGICFRRARPQQKPNPAPPDKTHGAPDDANSRMSILLRPMMQYGWRTFFLWRERSAPDGCLDAQGVFVITPNSAAVAPC